MKNLNKTLDQDRKVLTREEIKGIEGSGEVDVGAESSESIFYVLVETRWRRGAASQQRGTGRRT